MSNKFTAPQLDYYTTLSFKEKTFWDEKSQSLSLTNKVMFILKILFCDRENKK